MPSNGGFRQGFGSGFVRPWEHSQSWPRWGSNPQRNLPLGNNWFFVVPPPIVPYPGYPPDAPYYSQPPPYYGTAFPQADVTQVPTTVSSSFTNQDTHFNAVGGQPREMSTAGSSDLHMYQSPGPPPSYSDDHPALIALKDSWAYSVQRYWVQGKVFHFITSRGDHMQVPVTQVERIYPSSRQSNVTESK
jgi:hypothetical protein